MPPNESVRCHFAGRIARDSSHPSQQLDNLSTEGLGRHRRHRARGQHLSPFCRQIWADLVFVILPSLTDDFANGIPQFFANGMLLWLFFANGTSVAIYCERLYGECGYWSTPARSRHIS